MLPLESEEIPEPVIVAPGVAIRRINSICPDESCFARNTSDLPMDPILPSSKTFPVL
ncbi:hypothetical protein MAL08_07410 [Leptospira noguchii]|uniref:hypothetical protein n=1 Tax=Leptospira noguchii TaxID=28182 RepID=UPI001FB6D716|nr:hypothetical protein [Leptospira noguchii]UOG39096.1 hypothetical protein MAL08_07410 [Leptospira noguchii]